MVIKMWFFSLISKAYLPKVLAAVLEQVVGLAPFFILVGPIASISLKIAALQGHLLFFCNPLIA
jgi:hypothetical protein